MRTDIMDILLKEGIEVEQTIYREEMAKTLFFPFQIGDFLKWERLGEAYQEFAVIRKYRNKLEEKRKSGEYQEFITNIRECEEILACLRKLNKKEEPHNYQDLIREIRKCKRKIEEERDKLDRIYEEECAVSCPDQKDKPVREVITYKHILFMTTFKQLSFFMPVFKAISHQIKSEPPFFTSSVIQLQNALRSTVKPESIGIEGGPCLFGHDEVLVQIIHTDGEVFAFDYCDPRNYEMGDEPGEEDLLVSHLEAYGDQIAEMTFLNKKRGITTDEYRSLLYVFAFAHALHAKVVIPIPDMSYRKYLSALLHFLDGKAAAKAEAEFQKVIYDITDWYLDGIHRLKTEYPHIEVEVLHERNEALCRLYYKKRAGYCEKYLKKEISSNPYKKEAVLDYITMPALPFYIWGVKNVLQIDCISEADSFRKCMKMHDKAFILHGLFYVEEISGDGIHTMFSAKSEWKEYAAL